MPDSSSGVYSRPAGNIPTTGQTVEAIQVNAPIDDLSAAMTRRYMRDGRAPMLGNIPMNGYKAVGAANAEDPQDYVTLAQVQALIAAVASVPTGSIQAFSGTNIPNGWRRLNGQEVSRADNAALWAHAQASGNLASTEAAKTLGQFGPGNGATTFTLPNLEGDGGQFLRSVSSGRGIGTVQADELKSHTHSGEANSAGAHTHSYSRNPPIGGFAFGGEPGRVNPDTQSAQTSSEGAHTHTLSINSTGGTETRPKNVAYVWLIKA